MALIMLPPLKMPIANVRSFTGNSEVTAFMPPELIAAFAGTPSNNVRDRVADGRMVYDGVPLTIVRDPQKPDSFRFSFPTSSVDLAERRRQTIRKFHLSGRSFDKKGEMLAHTARELTAHLPVRLMQSRPERSI